MFDPVWIVSARTRLDGCLPMWRSDTIVSAVALFLEYLPQIPRGFSETFSTSRVRRRLKVFEFWFEPAMERTCNWRPMQNSDVYGQLTEIFREVFDDDTISLTPETTAADIRDWDSAAHVNLVVAIESRLRIRFKTFELESLHNVGHLAALVEAKLKAKEHVAQPG